MPSILHRVARRAAFAFAAFIVTAGGASADPVAIQVQPVPLDRSQPPTTVAGKLAYRGGVILESQDGRFGGLSGLWVSPDGQRLVAVSDYGDWLEARPTYDPLGELTGVADARMGRLTGMDGKPLPAQTSETDAEGLEIIASGARVVAFERHHRIWVYAPGTPPFSQSPRPFSLPPRLGDAPSNEGIEAFTELPDGRLLAITEGLMDGPEAIVGWIGDGTVWQKLTVAAHGAYRPTDAKALPNGDVILLERRYSPLTGAGARLRLIPRDQIAPGARLVGEELAQIVPPLSVDNFEGLGIRRGNGEWLIYLLSDDNFQSIQRTYLMMFALPDAR